MIDLVLNHVYYYKAKQLNTLVDVNLADESQPWRKGQFNISLMSCHSMF